MVNTAIDHLRKQKNILSLVHIDEAAHIAGEDGVQPTFDVEELQLYLQDLPNMTRIVFNLFAIEGYAHKEIAERLQITESTSRWHVTEARKRIQKLIEQHDAVQKTVKT